MDIIPFPDRTLNGSSMAQMAEDHSKVLHSLEKALSDMASAAPHPRDYIYRDDYPAVQAEYQAQLNAVRDLIEFHRLKAMHCFNQAR